MRAVTVAKLATSHAIALVAGGSGGVPAILLLDQDQEHSSSWWKSRRSPHTSMSVKPSNCVPDGQGKHNGVPTRVRMAPPSTKQFVLLERLVQTMCVAMFSAIAI
jgi:hypothetical protein